MFEEIKNLYRKYPERCCITLVILAAVLPFLPALSLPTIRRRWMRSKPRWMPCAGAIGRSGSLLLP